MTTTLKLWRPVGKAELALVEESGWKKWPPRLPEQPIFYPVLSFAYAEQIAKDWNSSRKDHDFTGYVTEFEVDEEYANQFQCETVGGERHKELWVPAECLEEFNDHIIGQIRLVAIYENKKKSILKRRNK